jgi:L-methionine (R)-S-oxide reductase
MSDTGLRQIGEVLALDWPREQKAARIAELIRASRSFHWVGVYAVQGDEIAGIGWTGTSAPASPRFLASQGLCGAALASRAPVVVGDVRRDPRYLTTFGSTVSETVVPVIRGDAVLGLIDVESDRLNAFIPPDIDFLNQCAALMGPLFD